MLKNVGVWGVFGGIVFMVAGSGCAHLQKKDGHSAAAVAEKPAGSAEVADEVFLETSAYPSALPFAFGTISSAAALVWPQSPASATEPPPVPAEEDSEVSPLPRGYPVPPEICHVISDFGARGRRQHKGVDIKAPGGAPVSATAPGIVRFAGTMRRYGKIVILDHADGYETRYAHLLSYSVKPGDAVEAGEIIGAVGRTGNASTPHVHYEVRRNGLYIDPDPFLETTASPE